MAKQMVSKSLQDQMKRATATAPKPSVIPQQSPPPPPQKVVEVIPDLTELIDDHKDQKAMKDLVATYIAWRDQEKQAKDEKDKLSEKIKTLVGNYGIAKVRVEGALVNYFSQERRTIKPELLMSHGVSPQIIDASTKVTETYTLRVTSGKDEE